MTLASSGRFCSIRPIRRTSALLRIEGRPRPPSLTGSRTIACDSADMSADSPHFPARVRNTESSNSSRLSRIVSGSNVWATYSRRARPELRISLTASCADICGRLKQSKNGLVASTLEETQLLTASGAREMTEPRMGRASRVVPACRRKIGSDAKYAEAPCRQRHLAESGFGFASFPCLCQ